MPSKRYRTEEIIHKLREAGVLLGQGSQVADVCKQLGVSEQTDYRWRKLYGGMQVDQARRRQAVAPVRSRPGLSERRVCRGLDVCRSAVRYVP